MNYNLVILGRTQFSNQTELIIVKIWNELYSKKFSSNFEPNKNAIPIESVEKQFKNRLLYF